MNKIIRSLDRDDALSHRKRILDAIKARNAALSEPLMEEHALRTIQRLEMEERNRDG